MRRLLVRIDKNEPNAIDQLIKFGELEKISILMNIFSVNTNIDKIEEIQKIKGVISIEQEYIGQLAYS